jgi:RHS repeat-associated protein
MKQRIIYILYILVLLQGVANAQKLSSGTPDPLKGLANRTSTSFMQIVDYKWHIRGGLQGINLDESNNANPNSNQKDLFSYKLEYESVGQWGGNIGKQSWNHVNGNVAVGVRSYSYTYDGLNQLKSATYTGLGTENYSISNVNYDLNGNITMLQRNGKKGNSFGEIDYLTYTYAGNRLSSVHDNVTSSYEVDFFKRGSGAYTYHPNGALNSDENEQITNIVYNTYLNLPEEITLTGGRWIRYTYDGDGKLIKTQYNTGEVWEYVEGFVFKNGQPYQVGIPEGRAILEGSTWKLEYDIKDHLGNTRVSFREGVGGAELRAKTDFDPWGVRLNGTGAVNSYQNRFELQGKEKEMTFGLNRIDFGARVYNPTIGRWDKSDPASEMYYSYSSFNYVLNNPLSLVDPNGMWVEKNGGQFTDDPEEIAAFLNGHRGTNNGDDDEKKKQKSPIPNRKLVSGMPAGIAFGLGALGGIQESGSFLASLTTTEGWSNIGQGFVNTFQMTSPDIQGVIMRANIVSTAVNYLEEVPKMTIGEMAYDLGYASEKVAEVAALRNISTGAGVGIGNVRILSNTTLRGTTLFKIGKNFRIDVDVRNGLHYHRRGPGGIGRHRPWQTKPGDNGSFKKRF